ncbi:MAG TPA: hypothetical protein VHH34_04850 [Pseudonocardiaceae bacterium]|nr:hypothetical protein [Pseudonocardiaceae bacterium]
MSRLNRDPSSLDGVHHRPRQAVPLSPANIVIHRHVCPDGTTVVARSQLVVTLGHTLDRFYVAAHLVGTAGRATSNTQRPEFTWLDLRALELMAA